VNCFCDAVSKRLKCHDYSIYHTDLPRYLYERECYDIAKSLINTALETFEDKSTLSYASTVDFSRLLDLDMNNPDKALIPFEEAYAIRKKLLEPTDGMIASSLNNIALAYTEMGEFDTAI